MSPRPRAAYLLGAVALSALVLPASIALPALAAVAAVTVVDAFLARRAPVVERSLPGLLSRGVAAPFRLELVGAMPGTTRLRQAVPPDLEVEPAEEE